MTLCLVFQMYKNWQHIALICSPLSWVDHQCDLLKQCTG